MRPGARQLTTRCSRLNRQYSSPRHSVSPARPAAELWRSAAIATGRPSKETAVAQLERFWQLFLAPLQAKIRLRFRNKSWWDDFVPYRKLSEILEFTRGLDPDDLLYAVAEGADGVTNTFRLSERSSTYLALSKLMDRAKVKADRLRPVWREHVRYLENTVPRARRNAIVETAKFVLGGDVTIGAALLNVFESLFDFEVTNEAAREASQFYSALEAFTHGVVDDLADHVMLVFANEFGFRD